MLIIHFFCFCCCISLLLPQIQIRGLIGSEMANCDVCLVSWTNANFHIYSPQIIVFVINLLIHIFISLLVLQFKAR